METDAALDQLRKEQLALETESVDEGVRHYWLDVEKAEARNQVADTQVGREMVRQILHKLVPAIEQEQKETIRRLTSTTGGAGGPGPRGLRSGDTPICCLSPAKLAVITARCVFGLSTAARTFTRLTKVISQNVKLEREFELWRDTERRKVQDALKAGEPRPVNMYDLLLQNTKNLNPRRVRPWMKRSADAVDLDWDPVTRTRLGIRLITLFLNSTDLFVEQMHYDRQKSIKCIALSEKGEEFVNNGHLRLEKMSAWYQPMVHPPLDWSRDRQDGSLLRRLSSLAGSPGEDCSA